MLTTQQQHLKLCWPTVVGFPGQDNLIERNLVSLPENQRCLCLEKHVKVFLEIPDAGDVYL